MRGHRSTAAVAIAVLIGGAGLTACGSTGSAGGEQPQSVDVGVGTIAADPTPDKIAVFVAGSAAAYTWSASLEKGAQQAAGSHNIDVEIFEANFDPAAQFTQIQSALTSKQYDGMVIQPASPQSCKLVTEGAVAAKVLVSVVGATLCGNDDQTGDDLWSPGTITYVGGQYGVPGFTDYIKDVVEGNPGPQKVIQVLGPQEFGITKAWFAAADPILAKNPDFQVVATVYTDYTTPDAFQKTQNALQANPDADIVVSQYIDLTRGVVNAVDALRRTDVRVYDFGASEESKKLVSDNRVVATFPTYPVSMGKAAVEAIVSAAKGEKVAKFIGQDGNPEAITQVMDITGVSAFTPEY